VAEPRGLALENVSAAYGARPVLHDLSLAVEPGEVTGLIGPNGSGKTTVVRVASRGLRPREGRVRVHGVDPYALSARQAARLVAVVPQELTPAFDYSVLELALMGRSPYRPAWGRADDWGKVRRAMAAANVQHLAERGMGELSGGERQRVILAQALAQDAPVLLLDEPTTHLDMRHVVEILSLVRGLARGEDKAVLAIFHDLNLASAYCDRIYVLSDGRMAAAGPPAEVLTRELIREVFEVDTEVTVGGASGRPAVVVAPPLSLAAGLPSGERAHVIGGAGRGAAVLRLLAERGFDVTTGVLHAGDTDETVAQRLNLLRVTVPPFSVIDARSADDCRDLIARASLLVVCDAPFGPGNLENLRLALKAAERGLRTILVEQIPIEERDFTGGKATELWLSLRELATVFRSAEDVRFAVRPG
jgi:iron complex transport system ATP-binding protein